MYAELGYRDVSVMLLFIEIMESEKAAVKYQAEKTVRKIREEHPAILLPGLLEAGGRAIWLNMRTKYLLSFRSRQAAEFGNAVSGIGKILKICPEEKKIMIPLLLNIDGHIFFSRGSL